MTARELTGAALVTGGGRGIGAEIARELAAAGMRVAVGARSRQQVEAVADEVGGLALDLDVRDAASIEHAVARTEEELGPLELLVANAGVGTPRIDDLFGDPVEWWQTFEVNVRGVYLSDRAAATRMIERGRGRIVNVTSGAAYQSPRPGEGQSTAYGPSKAAVHRLTEVVAAQLAPRGVFAFSVSPGLVQTKITKGFPEDTNWAPPGAAPRLVRALAAGDFDALAGRFLHAVNDMPEELAARIDEIGRHDLNAIRLRR